MYQKARKRPRIGDIVEIETPNGLAYAQYTHKHPRFGSLMRVLTGLYESRPSSFSNIVRSTERFFTFFPLGTACFREIVTIVSNEEIPESAKKFPIFRDGIKNPKIGKVGDNWYLWDGQKEWWVGKLTKLQRKFPIRSIWNDTLLIHRIIKNWSPEQEL